MKFFDDIQGYWANPRTIIIRSFKCGYCSDKVASEKGFPIYSRTTQTADGDYGGAYICPNCNGLTFFTTDNQQLPGEMYGNEVHNVPEDLNNLYIEARKCYSQNCYTAVVMLCRKMLMNVAVSQGAQENKSFAKYVNYLSEKNYIPPNGKEWVDHIRLKGNEANHEIKHMEKNDAKNLLIFIEMILKFVYEFPNMIIE